MLSLAGSWVIDGINRATLIGAGELLLASSRVTAIN